MDDIGERIACIEQDLKSVHRRLDVAERSAETISKLAIGIERLTVEIQGQRDDISDFKKRIDAIEGEPKNRLNTIWGIVAALIIGYAFNLIIGGM